MTRGAAPDVVIAGAGMAGLVAACQARELGARVTLLEKGRRPGGSMLLSSGVIWRHRRWADFRADCPGGDESLQRLIFERLDESLAWLDGLGAAGSAPWTGNPRTTGMRFAPPALTDALLARAGEPRLEEPLEALPSGTPTILATGGFQGNVDLVRRYITDNARHLVLRASPWSTGDGLRLGLAAGGSCSQGMDEFYGRNLPAQPAALREDQFVTAAQLYGKYARISNDAGDGYTCRDWSEIDVVQWTARQPFARARYWVSDRVVDNRIRGRSIRDMINTARLAGGAVRRVGRGTSVPVVAGITTTLGGLSVDPTGSVVDGVYACGQDIGGVATGGYASGLAAALVTGRAAAHAALGYPWK